MAKLGLLTRAHGAYHVMADSLPDPSFTSKRDAIVRTYDNLLQDLLVFARDRHGVSWLPVDADRALLELFADRRLRLTARASPRIVPTATISAFAKYIVASWITNLSEANPTKAADVAALAQGYMLANAFYVDRQKLAQRFDKTRIYLDTRFLLHALGYAGTARQAPAQELLALLRAKGAVVLCFRHTRDELHGVLAACERNLSTSEWMTMSKPMNETIRHFLDSGYNSSDIKLLAVRLDSSLAELGVDVAVVFSFDDHSRVIDHAGSTSNLQAAIPEIRPEPLERDVNSIASVMRERQGVSSSDVERCGALLVTTNVLLVRVARRVLCGLYRQVGGPARPQ